MQWWQIFIHFIAIGAGLFLVGKSAGVVIDKATKIAKLLHVREFIIGFVLLAVATSLPELAVAIIAIIQRGTGLTIGNLMGSSISNIGVLVAIGAILTTIQVRKKEFLELAWILLFTASLPAALIFFPQYSRYVGIVLILFFGIFTWRAITKKETLKEHKIHHEQTRKKIAFSPKLWKHISWFISGIIVLMMSAYLVVNSASSIASYFGVSDALIGATIITVGTLLPELAVTIKGLKSGRHSLVIGNAVGSAMTNIGLILGLVLITSPFTINPLTFVALTIFLLGFNAMLWVLIKDQKIDRIEGVILLVFYAMYLFMLIINSIG